MIRITQQNSATDAKRYYATADYYSQGQEIVGRWGGKGAARLGLEGTVDKFSFERLCDNLHPQTGKPLTVRTRSERRVGYDFTFSVPKMCIAAIRDERRRRHPGCVPRRGR